MLAFSEALGELDTSAPSQPVTGTEAALADATGGTSELSSPGRGPKPFRPDGRPITEYVERDLVRLIEWINSDGQLRTAQEITAVAIHELGYERTSAPRREVLGRAIAAYRGEPEQA